MMTSLNMEGVKARPEGSRKPEVRNEVPEVLSMYSDGLLVT
jgi:hypothetical protein